MVDIHVSSHGNFWVNLGQADKSTSVWAVFSPQGELLGQTLLNRFIIPRHFARGKMYATRFKAEGSETLVYSLDF